LDGKEEGEASSVGFSVCIEGGEGEMERSLAGSSIYTKREERELSSDDGDSGEGLNYLKK
jgi:hypothetical protein